MLDVVEDYGTTRVLHQLRRRRGWFENGPIGTQISMQYGDAAVGAKGGRRGGNNVAVVTRSVCYVLSHGLAIYRRRVVVYEGAKLANNGRQAPGAVEVFH